MSFTSRTSLLVGLAVLLSTSAVAGFLTPNAKYRKLKGTEGNCIFSTGGLPYQKEDEYTGIRDSFSTAERPAELRCYYPQQVQDYLTKGAFWNELRDENTYYNYVTVEPVGNGGVQFEQKGAYHPTADSLTWDQMRMIVTTADPKCNWKDSSSLGTNGCFDVDKQVRALASKEGAVLPYTGRLCVSVFVKWTDHFEQKWDESRQSFTKEKSKLVLEYIAQDCVTYTAQ